MCNLCASEIKVLRHNKVVEPKQVWILQKEHNKSPFLNGLPVPAFANCPHCNEECWLMARKEELSKDLIGQFVCDRCRKPFEGRVAIN